MGKNKKYYFYLLKFCLLQILFLCLFTKNSQSQTDSVFWFAPPEVSKSFNNFDRPIVLRMSTLNQPSTVTISMPAQASFIPIFITIPANNTRSIDLTQWIDLIESKPPNTVLNSGLKVSSSAPINVYYEVVSGLNGSCQCNPEIFVLKGRNGLGKSFLIPSQNLLDNDPYPHIPPPYSSFDIVATEDNTSLTIKPRAPIVGHAAGIPFNIRLNKGQVFSCAATGLKASDHLEGSTVTADKFVAITIKDDQVHLASCFDLGGDQIVPIENLSKEYIAVQGYLFTGMKDKVFVTAVNDNTKVYSNGSLLATLNADQTFSIDVSAGAAYITASDKIYALQLSGYGCEIGLSSLPSLTCKGSSSVSFTRSSTAALFLLIVTRSGNEGAFQLNGSSLSTIFNVVPGTLNKWVYARVPISLAQIPALSSGVLINTKGLFQMGLVHGDAISGGARFGYFSDFAHPHIKALPDSLLTCANSITLDPGPGFFNYEWNTGANTQILPVNKSGLYKVRFNNAEGCSLSDSTFVGLSQLKRDSIQSIFCSDSFTLPWGVIVKSDGVYRDTLRYASGCDSLIRVVTLKKPSNKTPSVYISASSTSICAGSQVTFTALAEGASSFQYQWMKNAYPVGVDAPTYHDTGLQNEDVVQCLIKSKDVCTTNTSAVSSNALTIHIINTNGSSFSLGKDTGICNNLLLNAHSGYQTYLWQDGSSDSTYLVKTSGTYSVKVTDACNHTFNASIKISNLNKTSFSLGKDTVVCTNSLLLNAHSGYQKYLWQDESSDSTYLVKTSGTYSVQVTDVCNNPFKASIKVTLNESGAFKLGKDTAICQGDSLLIKSPDGFMNYHWSPTDHALGTDQQQVIVFPKTNTTYTATAETVSKCSVKDSLIVKVLERKAINLSGETAICKGDSLLLQAGRGFASYNWSNGSTQSFIFVKETGVYSVKALNQNGCYSLGSFKLLQVNIPPVVTFPNDSSLCDNSSKILDAGPDYTSYLWNTGSTTRRVTINRLGIYSVLVKDKNGCKGSGTTIINTLLAAPAHFLPADTSICKNDTLLLQANSHFTSYSWSSGEHTQSISVKQPGLYYLHVTDAHGCEGNSYTEVKEKQCKEAFYVPNAFTPNGDGKNDVFKPILFGNVTSYRFTIFNRWGEKVFESAEVNKGWDGIYKGSTDKTSVFVWICTYQFSGKSPKTEKGFVMLIR